MKGYLTGREIQGLFDLSNNDLIKCRKDGLQCLLVDNRYLYKYNDVVEFLR